MSRLMIVVIVLLSACSPSPPPMQAYCWYPCLHNPDHLPLDPHYADKREMDQPGYKQRNAELRGRELAGETDMTRLVDELHQLNRAILEHENEVTSLRTHRW